MRRTKLITTMAVFIAIGTLDSQLIWFPAGVAKAYPVQHAINVMAAVILGTGPAVTIAFIIGVLRNLLGLGSLLAFPGGMIGAFLAGILYKHFKHNIAAAFGEVLGTCVIGSLFGVPFAKSLMGTAFGALFFIPPFRVRIITGGFIVGFIVSRINHQKIIGKYIKDG